METSPGEASSSSTNASSPTQECRGHEVVDRPSERLFRETKEAQCVLDGEEHESFIEEAACVEEELQEFSTLGLLPFEQRVKRRRLTGTQAAPGAGIPAEASPGGAA